MQICCVVCLWCVFFYICNEFHCNHWLNALLFSIVWCFGTVRLSWCCRDSYSVQSTLLRVLCWVFLCCWLAYAMPIFDAPLFNIFPVLLWCFFIWSLSPPLFNTNWRPCFHGPAILRFCQILLHIWQHDLMLCWFLMVKRKTSWVRCILESISWLLCFPERGSRFKVLLFVTYSIIQDIINSEM